MQICNEEKSSDISYVYLLECADNTLYCGWAKDVDKRVQCHNAGKGAKYTRARLPVKLVYHEKLSDKNSAMRREIEIKRMTRAQKLKLCDAYRAQPDG